MQRIQVENRTDLKSEIPLSTPYCIFIDPSSACNFKCGFCMNSRIKHPTIMPFSLFIKLIDDLQQFPNPVKTVRLYGLGEPLMNKEFCNMVRYAKSSIKVLRVDTTTNASLLNHHIITDLIDSGIDRINISISAVTTEKYRTFTKNNSVEYPLLVENLQNLFEHKLKHTTIFIKADGDLLTADEQQQFLTTFTPISDGCALEHTMSCWYDVEVSDVNTAVGVYGQPLEDVQVCPYVFYSFMVHADGYASACFLDWNKKLVIGDAKNESLSSLWNNKLMHQLRKQMLLKNRQQHPICCGCAQLKAGMPVNLDAHTAEILPRFCRG